MNQRELAVSEETKEAASNVEVGHSVSTLEPHANEERVAPLFFAVLYGLVLLALIYTLRNFIGDLVVAFILVGLVKKPYDWCLVHGFRNRWVASGLVTTLVALVVVGPVVALGSTIASEAKSMYSASDVLFQRGGALIDEVVTNAARFGISVSRAALQSRAESLVRGIAGSAVTLGGALVTNVFAMTFHLITVLVMVFYIRVDGEKLRKFIYQLSPLPDQEDALLEDTFRKVARGVVMGQGLGSALQGALGGVSFIVVGIPHSIFWGTVMAIAAFLPLVGVTAVALPAGIWLYFTGHPIAAVGVVAFNLIQGSIIENVVKTKLIGSAMRMHDLLVFLAMLGGIAAFGILGLVYGPLIAMLFMTLTDLYLRVYRPTFARRFAG